MLGWLIINTPAVMMLTLAILNMKHESQWQQLAAIVFLFLRSVFIPSLLSGKIAEPRHSSSKTPSYQ